MSEANTNGNGQARSAVTLTSLLSLADGPADATVEYVIGGLTLAGAAREQAAQMLADDAMRIRCGGSSPLYLLWRRRLDGGAPATGTEAKALGTYASLGFGLPDTPANDNHLQGLVAELLWNRLLTEREVCRDGRRLVRAHPVKPDPLEPGGDGLVVYEAGAPGQSTLVFRLWEIKKHESARPVSATIGRAAKQLASRGHEYLAKLAGPETLEHSGPMGPFYAEIVELWLDGGERAGAGVSVGTSAGKEPTSSIAFRSLNTNFPHFKRPSQAESVVVAVPNFPRFAKRVRKIVWTGL